MSEKNGPSGGILVNTKTYDTNPEHKDDVEKILAVTVWSGNRIDGLQIDWRKKTGGTASAHVGGTGGTENPSWPISPGEHLTGIAGSLDGKKDDLSLRVYTIQPNGPQVLLSMLHRMSDHWFVWLGGYRA